MPTCPCMLHPTTSVTTHSLRSTNGARSVSLLRYLESSCTQHPSVLLVCACGHRLRRIPHRTLSQARCLNIPPDPGNPDLSCLDLLEIIIESFAYNTLFSTFVDTCVLLHCNLGAGAQQRPNFIGTITLKFLLFETVHTQTGNCFLMYLRCQAFGQYICHLF